MIVVKPLSMEVSIHSLCVSDRHRRARFAGNGHTDVFESACR